MVHSYPFLYSYLLKFRFSLKDCPIILLISPQFKDSYIHLAIKPYAKCISAIPLTIKQQEAVKGATPFFMVSNPKVAFWFAFGKYGLIVVTLCSLLFSGWLYTRMSEKKEKDIGQISFLLEKSPVQEKKFK